MSLKDFQIKIGVSPDGEFGPATLKAAQKYYKMSDYRIAHFMAQCGHESGDFRVFSENLNYSAEGLMNTFKKYFPNISIAKQYARNPSKIANKVYSNRLGNGDEASGDGWRYKGKSAIQITGRDNYKAFSEYMKDPEILSNPDIVASKYIFEAPIWFFDKNKLWDICDKGINEAAITELSKKINGGKIGLSDRISKTYLYYKWLTK